MNDWNLTTQIIQSGIIEMDTKGFVSMPIVQSSTFYTDGVDEQHPFGYSRTNNPTRKALEDSIALLEGAQYCTCYSSGLAAVHSVSTLLKEGDEIVIDRDCYLGTFRLLNHLSSHFDVKVSERDLTDPDWIAGITDNVKLIWLETPTNPLLKVVNIKRTSEAIKRFDNVLLVVDNTFATPYFQQPLALGADIVVHSASKYLGGHSDTILGAVVCKSEDVHFKMKFSQNSFGAIPGPLDCFLVLRGLKTLAVRMKKHQENAIKIAEFLSNHKQVDEVFFPGITKRDDPREVKQMSGWGGVVTFNLKDDNIEATKKIINRLSIFKIAESLGGVESLVNAPAMTSFLNMDKNTRLHLGLKDSTIRLSVGIEDYVDLINDLETALNELN